MIAFIRKIILSFLLLISFVGLLISQTTSFKINCDEYAYAEKPFVISYEYVGKHMPRKFGNMDFGKDFKIIYNADNKSNIDIDGKIKIIKTYTLSVDKPGKYKIPSFSIIDENGTKKTIDAKYITIIKSLKDNEDGVNRLGADKIILTSVLSKKVVYQYEPIYMLFKLYYDGNGVSPVFEKYPTIENFLLEPLDQSQNMGLLDVEKFNGKNYKTISFGNSIITPTKNGKLEIDPISFYVSISQTPENANSFINSGTKLVKKEYSTPPVFVDVMPIPEKDRPNNYFGLVGDFTATLTTDNKDNKEYSVGDAITIKLTVSGVGYLKPIDIVKPIFPNSFDVYDPKINYSQTVDKDGIHCTKEIDYTIIPNSVGSYEIPSVDISFFNPYSSTFKTIKTDKISIKVKKGSTMGRFAEKSSEVRSYSFIDKLISSDVNVETSYSFIHILIYIVFYILAVFVAFIVYKRIIVKRRIRGDLVSFNYSKANIFAKKRLLKAHQYIENEDSKGFYQEMMKVLWDYASHKLKTPIGELNKENVRDKFLAIDLNDDEIKIFLDLLSLSEMARYSIIQVDDNLEDVYNKALSFITLMERKGK